MPSPHEHGIESLRVGPLKPLHPGHQVGRGGLQEQMIVIGHPPATLCVAFRAGQYVGMNPPACLLTNLRQGLQEKPPPIVGDKDFLSIVPMAHDVVMRSLIFFTARPWHSLWPMLCHRKMQLDFATIHRLTLLPFTDSCGGAPGID